LAAMGNCHNLDPVFGRLQTACSMVSGVFVGDGGILCPARPKPQSEQIYVAYIFGSKQLDHLSGASTDPFWNF